jgi:excisionase family DNA binding protein
MYETVRQRNGPMNKHSPTGKRRKHATAVQSYLSLSDFARHLGVSRVTVWRWIRSGRLRHIRLSSMLVRIPVSEVERLARQPVNKRPPLHLTRREYAEVPTE